MLRPFLNKFTRLCYIKNIGHRELKPENIIYFEKNLEIIFKIVDKYIG